jgi:hypothetical protein
VGSASRKNSVAVGSANARKEAARAYQKHGEITLGQQNGSTLSHKAPDELPGISRRPIFVGSCLFDLLIGSHILQVVSFDFTCALAHLGAKMKVLEMNRCFDSVGGGLKLFRPYCVQIPAKNT